MDALRSTTYRLGRLRPGLSLRHAIHSIRIATRSFSASGAFQASTATNLGALKSLLKVSEEVTDALAANKPVVALESTIYTHGALGDDLDLEGIVRRNGGVPAVVGILNGVPTVGLTPGELSYVVQGSPKKASRRDLAYLVGMGMTGKKINGGTTIAGTMVLARMAGIRVFGTGGLGGVHRGGHESFDISADLTELGRTRMAVICSGCKGFLDIPRTLEYLETQGVLVSTFANDKAKRSVDFPAFWARNSGVKSPFVIYDEEQAAAIILAQERLGVESGLVFAEPIPKEFSIHRDEMDAIIEKAVYEATEQGIAGNENTPFILKRIRDLTEGRSVPANKALVQANVKKATKVAVEVSRLISGKAQQNRQTKLRSGACYVSEDVKRSAALREEETNTDTVKGIAAQEPSEACNVFVAGSVAVDLSCDYSGKNSAKDPLPHLHTSNPSHIRQSIGGVGRNVALAAHSICQKNKIHLCSMVGDDLAGSTVLASLASCGMDTSTVKQLKHTSHQGSRTAQYVAVNDAKKNLVLAMADMDIFTTHSTPSYWSSAMKTYNPRWLVVDANWTDRGIRSWMQVGKQNKAHVAFEPVSKEKSARLFCPGKGLAELGVFPNATIDLASPNQYELAAMHAAAQQNEYFDSPHWWKIIDAFGMRGARERFVKITSAAMTDAGIPQQAIQLLPYIPTIITKMGSQGALLTTILRKDDPRLYDAASEPFILARSLSDSTVGGVYMRLFPASEEVEDAVSVNGVGDTFLGTLIAGLAQGGKAENLINVAQKAAVLTLRSSQSVSEELEMLEDELLAACSS